MFPALPPEDKPGPTAKPTSAAARSTADEWEWQDTPDVSHRRVSKRGLPATTNAAPPAIMIAGAVVATAVFLACLFVGRAARPGSSMNPWGLFFFAVGLFALCGAGFNWDWFMEHRKARFVSSVFGRTGARIFYALLGTFLLGIGGLAIAGMVQR